MNANDVAAMIVSNVQKSNLKFCLQESLKVIHQEQKCKYYHNSKQQR